MPDVGWDEASVRLLVTELSCMDSNNFLGNVGAGEREGRVYSSIIRERHFLMSHGCGRSGNILENQPKAAGSSLVNQLTPHLALDALRLAGMRSLSKAVILPVATGFAMCFTMSLLRSTRLGSRFAIWSRIDQKSCIKAMACAGLDTVVVEPVRREDSLHTNVAGIEMQIVALGAHAVACVNLTTSGFAPRVPDDVEAVGEVCFRYGVPLVVNNAYGVQDSKCSHLIESAMRNKCSRVDFVIQSCDKNFMVPVGGSVVASPESKSIDSLAQFYPGRASLAPAFDLFVTLLQMGRAGLRDLYKMRAEQSAVLRSRIRAICDAHGLRVLESPGNRISLAINLTPLVGSGEASKLKEIGATLFSRRVSGARVIVAGEAGSCQEIAGLKFSRFGSHCDDYPYSYLTIACAVGMKESEVARVCTVLDESIALFKLRLARNLAEQTRAE